MNETVDARIGDYVVVLVSGKARTLKYLARIDDINADDKYEGVFLSKVNAKIKPGKNLNHQLLLLMKKMVHHFHKKTLFLNFRWQLLLMVQQEEVASYVLILILTK